MTHPAVQNTIYRSGSSRSSTLHERALRVMPSGNTRHSVALSPYPPYIRSGKGCRVVDVEGDERLDFLNNMTSLIHGHANEQITRAVYGRIQTGTAFSGPTEEEVELAELIANRVPYIDQIRFCNSGTEAVMFCIKAARVFTGRAKVARFEGAYHGSYDFAEVGGRPVAVHWGPPEAPASVAEHDAPPSVADEVIVLPWNNFEACRDLIRRNRNSLAAVLVDPLPTSIGMIAPRDGFLELLREETEQAGVLLIADEVMSFRLAYDGAMRRYGINPDLVSLAKMIGGGFPVGAVAGSKQVMSVFDNTGGVRVSHSGTFNANPVTMTAGLEAMKQLTPDAYDRLNSMGDYLRERLVRLFRDRGIGGQVCGQGSLFMGHLSTRVLIDYRSLVTPTNSRRVYPELCDQLLAHGILASNRGIFGCLSTPMTMAELDAYVDAVDRSFTGLSSQ
jgi:glutamate-1-semialdehyde 2,1-aminomutase